MIANRLEENETMSKTTKEKRQAIKDLVDMTPRGQFRPGLYIKTVGTKWVHVVSVCGKTSVTLESIDKFWFDYVADFSERCAAGGIKKRYSKTA